jgi:glycosyltransferase involved in cell wall biosynthesis
MIKERGIKFHWYVIGPGNHEAIDNTIHDLRVDDCVHFIGPKSNPYPWMKACDIYVQPSRYEGHSVTVREAQILLKPVIITNYPTAKSQIRDGIDGVICGMDNESIADAIISLAQNNLKQEDLVNYLRSHDYGNESEIEKIYKLLNIV